MITIYCDPYGIVPAEAGNCTFVAEKPQDYAYLAKCIGEGLCHPVLSYTLHVRSQLLIPRLDYLRRLSSETVRFHDVTPKTAFERKFGHAPVPELTDDAIASLCLLDLPKPGSGFAGSIRAWILSAKLDPVWGQEPGEEHVSAFTSWAATAQAMSGVMLWMGQAQIAEWAAENKSYRVFQGNDIQEVARRLILRWATDGYPDSFALKQDVYKLPFFSLDNYPLACRTVLGDHYSIFMQFWGGQPVTMTDAHFEKVISIMSGLSLGELEFAHRWVETNSDKLTERIAGMLKRKFAYLPAAADFLQDLDSRVPPPVPEIPPAGHVWNADQWLVWATEQYLPMFRWALRNQPEGNRSILEPFSRAYSDWLVNAYVSLLLKQESSGVLVTGQLGRILALVQEEGTDVVLWLIVDGLTWWQAERLAQLYSQAEVGISDQRPVISALPSITTISKRALVRGFVSDDDMAIPIAKVLQNRLQKEKVPVFTFTQESRLEATIAGGLQSGVYALFYNGIDSYSHETTSFTLNAAVDGHLKLLVDLTRAFFRKCQVLELTARAVVGSDHGSTLLPRQAKSIPIPPFAQAYDDEEEDDAPAAKGRKSTRAGKGQTRTRACAVDRLPDKGEQQVEEQWYLLRSDRYHLPQHFIIPKTYSAIGRLPSGWTHGGSSPEETITAAMELQPAPINVIAPDVVVIGVLVTTPAGGSLDVTVSNPNDFPLRNLRFGIRGESDVFRISSVAPHDKQSLNPRPPMASGDSNQVQLSWYLSYEAAGREHQTSGTVLLKVEILQAKKSDFEAMFDFDEDGE